MGRRAYHLAMITGDNNGSDGILCNDDVARRTQQSNRAKERGGERKREEESGGERRREEERGGERKSQGGGGIYFYDDPSIDMLSMYGE